MIELVWNRLQLLGLATARARKSFEVKIIGLCLVATVSALTIAFAAFQWQDWQADRQDLRDDQITLGQKIAPEAALATGAGGATHLTVAGAMARSSDQTVSAVWFPSQGGSVTLLEAAPDEGAGATPAASRPSGAAFSSAGYEGERLVVRVPYFERGRRVGELVMQAHDHEISDGLARNSLIAFSLAIVATLVSAVLAGALARRGLRPLYALDRGIEAARRLRDFKARVNVISDDEFGRLTTNFNALLTDLQTYDERLQLSLQDLTVARDTAEQANTMKSDFLANMSHEIRTPLNGVLGMAQVMAMGQLAKVQRERLSVIQKSGGALLTILNDILDLSKIEAGRLELEVVPFDIGETMEAACEVFYPVADGKGVAFSFEVEPPAMGRWRGDSTRIRQVVQNLVSNALKFTTEGHVKVWVGVSAADGALLIRVDDTGIGIPADVLPRLFDKFVQADSSTTRQFGGTGLGLTICREIVELMGGRINGSSEAGRGSTFEVTLPLERLADAAPVTAGPVAKIAQTADVTGLRVLVADDNPTNQLVAKTLLHAFGVKTAVVDNGRAAVEAWKGGGFDLILMDIQMPDMDGLAATCEIRRIEAERALPRTPVVALSANAMRHQVSAYLAAGMDAHLAKPIVVGSLHAALSEVAARRQLQVEVA